MSNNVSPLKLKPLDYLKARSLLRSLFMEGEWEQYPTWQEAISLGSLHWSFTAQSFRETVPELGRLLDYPEAELRRWLSKICSGLPNGTPDPSLSPHEFIRLVRDIILDLAEEWERNGKPERQ